MAVIAVAGALLAGACGGSSGTAGASCSADSDCATGTCLHGAFTGGYCTSDCSTAACPDGQSCHAVSQAGGSAQACLVACTDRASCRDGYMCWQGVCQPSCAGDGDCGTGFQCASGACMPLPGKSVGDACASDGECSSRLCDQNSGKCQLSCTTDDSCAKGQTCYVNPVDTNGDAFTDTIRPICIATRGGKAPGDKCSKDADCNRGSCQLGICTNLCTASGQCTASMSCQKTVAQIDNGAPAIQTCVPRSGTLTIDLGSDGSGPIGVPANVVGMNILVRAKNDNIVDIAGLSSLVDPKGNTLYMPAQSLADYYALPLRYQPSEGTSMVLVPNGPNAPISSGQWMFSAGAGTSSGVGVDWHTTVRMKFADAPPTKGSIPLHIFLTSQSGAPCHFGKGDATFEGTLQQLFAQTGLTIGPITYQSSTAPNQITVPTNGNSPDLDKLLAGATAQDTPDALEVVVINQINSNDPNGEILGIAGGVPAATGVPGTPHSGVAVSLSSLCYGDSKQFAITAAHELGHTLGLFHNVEADGHTSPLGDDAAEGTTNLMYWAEDSSQSGQHLTASQAHVVLANPAVAE